MGENFERDERERERGSRSSPGVSVPGSRSWNNIPHIQRTKFTQIGNLNIKFNYAREMREREKCTRGKRDVRDERESVERERWGE